MSVEPEKLLPSELLRRASLHGNEYAWSIDDIQAVIDAAETAGLVNVGGQLQLRTEWATAECYWIEVDSYSPLPHNVSWPERVRASAQIARDEFEVLKRRFDFEKEIREAFPRIVERIEREGLSVYEVMCFEWGFETEGSYSNSTMT